MIQIRTSCGPGVLLARGIEDRVEGVCARGGDNPDTPSCSWKAAFVADGNALVLSNSLLLDYQRVVALEQLKDGPLVDPNLLHRLSLHFHQAGAPR